MRQRGAFAAVLGSAAIMMLPAQAGAVSFFRGDFAVGTHPVSVAVGNFNGGAPDLAVANEGSNNVSILLGNGFGQFAAGASVPVGDVPSSVAVGEFNGDAFADLAIASIGGDNIAIRLGTGAGTFTGTGSVSTGSGSDPRAIAVGDLTNDGKADLVSANNGSSTVSTHIGDGTGGFAADATPKDVSATASIPAANPLAIAVIQLGGTVGVPDNNLDVMVASQTSDQVLKLFGDGTGEYPGSGTTYTAALSATDPNPSAIAVGSLNPGSPNPGSAAEPDILIANVAPDQVFPAYGRTDGQAFDFGGVLATGAGSDPVGLAMGDLDGDGDQDGITANSGTASATAIISDGGGGTSVDTSHPVGTSPRSVATAAFDADARADAVVANYTSNSVTALTSLQPGPVANPPTPPAPASPKKCKKGKKLKKGTTRPSRKCVKKKRRK
jgi:hypothetical protein